MANESTKKAEVKMEKKSLMVRSLSNNCVFHSKFMKYGSVFELDSEIDYIGSKMAWVDRPEMNRGDKSVHPKGTWLNAVDQDGI